MGLIRALATIGSPFQGSHGGRHETQGVALGWHGTPRWGWRAVLTRSMYPT